jgi:serine/threonine-protein kinase HipA
LPEADVHRFFEQVAFTVMVSNGDSHLKNFDVVTTRIYRYARLQGGADLEDQTLALKLFAGKGQTRTYPTTAELLCFGRDVCHVAAPQTVLARIADAMSDTMAQARQDTRIPSSTLADMAGLWGRGMTYAA